jgi:hypothetical protein
VRHSGAAGVREILEQMVGAAGTTGAKRYWNKWTLANEKEILIKWY